MFSIFKKEVKSYFYSPIAYVLIGLFILLSSIFFFLQNLLGQVADFNNNLALMGLVLVFIIPILTMRILAEDRKNGTEVLLLTSPVNITEIVLGKYLAAFFVFLVMTCITFIYPIVLFRFGQPPIAQTIGGYAGFILLGASFIAVGLFTSSVTENQVIAAVFGFVALVTFWIMSAIAGAIGGIIGKILGWFSLLSRYGDFNMGILNISPIIYYISFIAVFLFLTIRIIERRRWSQG